LFRACAAAGTGAGSGERLHFAEAQMDTELLRNKSPYITLVKICLPVAAKIHTPATSLPVPKGGSEG
jgi:hypothetical protein